MILDYIIVSVEHSDGHTVQVIQLKKATVVILATI